MADGGDGGRGPARRMRGERPGRGGRDPDDHGATTSTVPVTQPPATATPEVTVAPPVPVLVDGSPRWWSPPVGESSAPGSRWTGTGSTAGGRQAGRCGWASGTTRSAGSCRARRRRRARPRRAPDRQLRRARDGRLPGLVRRGRQPRGSGPLRPRCSGATPTAASASFTVILPGESTEEPTGTRCDGYVAFGPGEDLAGDIYADGLSCEEAKAFLQAHAEPTGALTAPPTSRPRASRATAPASPTSTCPGPTTSAPAGPRPSASSAPDTYQSVAWGSSRTRRGTPGQGMWSMKTQARRWIEVGPQAARAALWRGHG